MPSFCTRLRKPMYSFNRASLDSNTSRSTKVCSPRQLLLHDTPLYPPDVGGIEEFSDGCCFKRNAHRWPVFQQNASLDHFVTQQKRSLVEENQVEAIRSYRTPRPLDQLETIGKRIAAFVQENGEVQVAQRA